MKNFVIKVYKFSLRGMGRYGLLLSVLCLASVTLNWTNTVSAWPLLAIGLVALALSVMMALKKFTPNWVYEPDTWWKAGVIFIGSGPLVLLFGMTSLGAVVPLGLENEVGKTLSVAMTLPAWLLGTVMGWGALFYWIIPDKGQPKPPVQSDIPPAPQEQVDLRSLRHARMTRPSS